MIQDDIRFFRQNFSASSLSDFHDTPKKHPLYQTKNNRLNVPKLKVITRETNHQKEEQRFYQRGDIQYMQSKNFNSKSQYKMLNKLKNQHQEIKHMHPQSQEQSVWVEESDRASQPGRLKFKASKSQKKEQEDQRRGRNSASELKQQRRQKQKQRQRQREKEKERQRQREKQMQVIRQSNQMQTDKAKQLSNKIQEKDKLIKKLRNSQQQIAQQYKTQIKHLKSQIDKLIDENTSLKKQLISKQLQNKELREDASRRQNNDSKSLILEKQLQSSRDKEREYLETIRMLHEKEQLPALPNIGLLDEINNLKQIVIDNDLEWQRKLSQALENERRIHAEAIQRLQSSNFQIPPTPMSEMVLNNHSNFQEVSNQQANQFMRTTTPPVMINPQIPQQLPQMPQMPPFYQNQGFPHYPLPQYQNPQNPYPNIYVRGPEFQKDRGERVIELLVTQLQQLRRPSNPIEDQLRNIKQSIRALMKKPSQLGGKQYKQLAVTTDSLHMVSELQNLKMYIIKQQNARKNYTQQVSYYRSQHTILVEQNKQLKSQVTSLQQSLDVATLQNDEYNRTVMELRVKVEQKTRHIQQLASSLANIQTNKIDTYTKIKTNVDRQRSHQLETEVQRLRALLQTEVIQLNKTHDDKIRGLQLHIHNQQKRIKDLQQLVRVAKQQVKQTQNQFAIYTDKSTKDITNLRQANQRLQQENISYKMELTSFATNNHHLQAQVKERTHVIDHLWMVKQAEYDNIFGQLARLREGYIL